MGTAALTPTCSLAVAGRRRADVLALVVLFAGATAMLLLAVLFPMSAQAPIALGEVMIVVAAGMAVGTFAAGDRLPLSALVAQVLVAAVCNTILVAAAHTTAGAMGDGLAYVWLAIYVAIFAPRVAVPFAVTCAALYGAGLLVADVPRMLTPWGVLSISTLAIAFVLGCVSRWVRTRVRTDTLTGALNRDGLAAAADRMFARARRRSDEIAVAVVDFDRFKEVNDREGHASGDRLLRDAAAAWHAVLRTDDVLARTGGDEFVLLLPRTAPDEVPVVLDRLQAAHPVAWSVGVTQWQTGESLADSLERADRRLYEAKGR